MDEATLKFGLTAFATLLVVVDPFGVLPIFISLARNPPAHERSRLATGAVVLGFMISLFLLRPGGLHVVTRVLAILLAALAVQFVLNGISEFVRLLEPGRR